MYTYIYIYILYIWVKLSTYFNTIGWQHHSKNSALYACKAARWSSEGRTVPFGPNLGWFSLISGIWFQNPIIWVFQGWLSNPRFVYMYIIYIYMICVLYTYVYIHHHQTYKMTMGHLSTPSRHVRPANDRSHRKKNTRTAWFIVDFHGSLGDVSRISWISQRCFFMVHDIHHFFMNPLLIWSVHVWSLLERKTRYIVWSQHETKKTRKRQLSILVSMFHALKPKND